MKLFKLLIITFITLASSQVFSQTRPINLMIDHSLDSFNYEPGLEFKLWNDRTADFDYLMYYIHDLQMITSSGDTIGATGEHYLIDAEEIEYGIGDWNADSVTKVIFNWGVSLDANHADPGQYLSTHPLAPQYPTMHWGWSAGYRFIRADGTFDDNGDGTPNLIFQYHMVGDQFVKKVSVDAHSMINANDELEVWITGYYERLFNEINLSMFPSVHGSTTPIPNLWVNITTEPVFEIFDGRMEVPVDTADTSTGINLVENLNSLSIYPNPSIDGYVKVSLEQPISSEVQFDLVDLSGRIQDSYRTSTQGFVEFTDLAKGFYIIKATDEFGDIIAVSKVQVQ
jgi:hypothetical protein